MSNVTDQNQDVFDGNFVYDSEGNLIEDKSKSLKISYDWRGMPVEFRMETRAGNVLENTRGCSRGDSLMLTMAYDGSGRRMSKTGPLWNLIRGVSHDNAHCGCVKGFSQK